MDDAIRRAETARALQAEARAVLERLGLIGLLAERYSPVTPTGSFAYGLMVWRDIDIHMPVPPQDRLAWARLGTAIAERLAERGMRLHKAQFLDDYVDPHPLGAGLYWGIEFRDHLDQAWKADLWGWAPDDFTRRRERDAELTAALASADRDLILRLKTEARERPDYYGHVAGSMDIYRFAIARGGESLAELEAWLGANR